MRANYTTTIYLDHARTVLEGSLAFTQDQGSENDVLNLYPEEGFQTFEGFGGAFTDSAGYVYAQMSEAQRRELITQYFSPAQMNYTLGRIHLDSCDFSMAQYEAMSDPADRQMQSLTLDRALQYALPMIEDVRRYTGKEVELMVSPWSPPAFMKTNGERSHGGSLREGYQQFWADYICRYIQALRDAGLQVRRLSVQNEPKAVQTWDSCVYTAAQERAFLKDSLYPTLRREGLSDIGIYIWDHNKERVYERACAIIDAETTDMIRGIAFHWYSGDHFEALDLIRRRFPDKELILSEACIEYSKYGAEETLTNAQRYAHDIIGNLNAGMNAFYDWNLLLDQEGGPNHVGNYCAAPYHYDREQGVLRESSTLWYLWHFSHYIQPGAQRIGYSRYTTDLEMTALQNPNGEMVTVLLNRTDRHLPAILRLHGQEAPMILPPQSITTVQIGPEDATR